MILNTLLKADLVLWDLDYTLIDSSKRYKSCLLPCGSLDIPKYRNSQTKKLIDGDKLTPLKQNLFDVLLDNNVKQWAITARECNNNDLDYLRDNGLHFSRVFSRDNVTPRIASIRNDGVYKRRIIQPILNLKPFRNKKVIMIDDNTHVINHVGSLGIECYNALELNSYFGYTFEAGI
jgi:hypothetical protein